MNKNEHEMTWVSSLDMCAPFIKITGGAGTGKSCGLVQCAAHLRRNGIDASAMMVLCSTQSSADSLMAYAAGFPELDGVLITTVAQYAVDMLSHDEVRQLTGRNPRILADFEYRILMEDMKVCGLKPKRLREMLKFFYKELSELGDEKESFIQDSEESDVYQTLQENLRLRNAMLRQELSNIAYKFVRDHAPEAASFKRPYVFVDDFQNLNCASQLFVEKLATKNLTLAGSLNEQVSTTEPYPYPKGFRTFEFTHDGVAHVTLTEALRCPDGINAMANSLVLEGGLQAGEAVSLTRSEPCEVRFVEWTYPNDEFLGIARYIKHRLEDAHRLIHPRDIFVAVPNAVWGNALAKVLRANHIKADLVTSHHALGGDPRVLEKSLDMQAYTRLALVADPLDAVAWRSWCGFGDYLTNSNHWFRLEKYAQEMGIGVLDALERAALLTEGELFTGAHILVERYLQGCAFIEGAAHKQGFTLANACAPVRGDKPPARFMSLLEPIVGGESAQELLARANGRLELRFDADDAVRIGLMEMSCGLEFDTVIFMGAVEGFYPNINTYGAQFDDERIADIRKQELREWYAAMTKARYGFVCSTVQKDESNTAASLGMHVHRIRMENGKSLAILAPTPYIEEFGDAAPCFETTL